MNLENASQIVNEGCKIIGLKNEDMIKLEEAMNAKIKESSFTATSDIIQSAVDPIVNANNEVNVEPVISGSGQPVYNVEQPQQVVEPAMVNTPNIFDQPMTSVSQENAVPNGEMGTNVNLPIYNATPVDEVTGGPQIAKLDTPQTFFDRFEEPSMDSVITQEQVESNNYSEEPAILMLENIKKIVEDKNNMIKVLSDKVKVLEGQLRNEIEARKMAEAQKSAAESTLVAARNAEVANMQASNGPQVQGANGPILTYQQPNYQQTVY